MEFFISVIINFFIVGAALLCASIFFVVFLYRKHQTEVETSYSVIEKQLEKNT